MIIQVTPLANCTKAVLCKYNEGISLALHDLLKNDDDSVTFKHDETNEKIIIKRVTDDTFYLLIHSDDAKTMTALLQTANFRTESLLEEALSDLVDSLKKHVEETETKKKQEKSKPKPKKCTAHLFSEDNESLNAVTLNNVFATREELVKNTLEDLIDTVDIGEGQKIVITFEE